MARNLCRLFWRDLEIHDPGIDSLRAVGQQRKDAEERITAARGTPSGEVFTTAGQQFRRHRPGQAGRVNITEVAAGKGATSPTRKRPCSGRGPPWKSCGTSGSASRR